MRVKMTIKYELGHSYDETWERTDYFCPSCGKQPVWEEAGPGDYYMGTQLLCVICKASFYLPTGYSQSEKNWQNQQRLAALEGK